MHSVVGRTSPLPHFDVLDGTHSLSNTVSSELSDCKIGSLRESRIVEHLNGISETETLFTSREISLFSTGEEMAEESPCQDPDSSSCVDITEMVRKLLESQKEFEDANDRIWLEIERITSNL
ncbi:MAG: hypothetical protein Q8L98_05290 [Chlamydiales bacterium]|nr:hypothetical protein [Chlamydiales bacterium]